MLCILEFLPIVNILHPYIRTALKVSAMFFFLLNVMSCNFKLFTRFAIILFIITLITLQAFYSCWYRLETIGSFVLTNLACWIYMEIGIFLLMYGTTDIKRMLRFCFLAILVVTAITSIFSLDIIPEAVRSLGNGSKGIRGYEQYLYRRNTATWSILYGTVFALPYLIMWMKEQVNRLKKIILLSIIVLLSFFIIKSQVFLGIIFSVVFFSFIFFKPLGIKKIILISCIMFLFSSVIMLYSGELFFYFNELAKITNSEVLQWRTRQVYLLISEFEMTGTIRDRFDLYIMSLVSFLENPIVGVNLEGIPEFTMVGQHSQILDMLAVSGLVGAIPLVFCLIWLIKLQTKYIQDSLEKKFYTWSIALLFLLMFLNPTYYATSVFFSVFLGPFLFQSDKKYYNK